MNIINELVKVIDKDDAHHGQFGHIRSAAEIGEGVLVEFDGERAFHRYVLDQLQFANPPKEDRPNEMLKHESFDPQATAIALVKTLFYGESMNPDDVYIVWFANTLQNWKALVSTNVKDNMYYEVTYNGGLDETYVDAYEKTENIKVKTNGHGEYTMDRTIIG